MYIIKLGVICLVGKPRAAYATTIFAPPPLVVDFGAVGVVIIRDRLHTRKIQIERQKHGSALTAYRMHSGCT